MADMEKILMYIGRMAEDLEGLINEIGCDIPCSEAAIYVDGKQNVNFVGIEKAMEIIDSFEDRSLSEMIGKSDYILIYDAGKRLVINGESYIPSDFLIMKSNNGLCVLGENDIIRAIDETESRTATLYIGEYSIQAYKLG